MTQRAPFQCIGVGEAQDLMSRGDALLLDVRDAASFSRGHIDGAQHVAMIGLTTVIQGTAKSRPIVICCYHGHASREYAQILSDFGFAKVYSVDGGYQSWSDRLRAAGVSPLDETLRQWLTEHGFPPGEVNAVIANRTTPLMKASHQGRSDMIRLLVAAGARLEATNADGNNALWLACVGSHLDVIDLLVESGIDIDNRNDNGATALMYAASSGKAGAVERLLAKGADTTPETLDGFTALDMVATAECLALLRSASRAVRKAEPSRASIATLDGASGS